MAQAAARKPGIWIPAAILLALAAAAATLQALPDPVRAGPRLPAARLAAAPRLAPALPAPRPVPLRPSALRATALADVPIRHELAIPRWLRPGEFAWDDEHAPPGGETIIVVNLAGRVLSIYRGGYEIGRSSIVWGSPDKPTPTGTFHILEKDADHRSRTYGGAPMPHMLRLTGDGVALHGSQMADDLATHGCVGLPREFAALLYRAARVGDRVLIRAV
ncbi:MAG TPA: L,D-transpeptidase family protein [Allosphingosinicella sp.]|jgi:lipoprotein-anchoring transpeptidase ErfK/SrfK